MSLVHRFAGGSLLVAAFYVAPGGSDANPGTFALPFATHNRASTAMIGSATIKTTYTRSGTYTYASTWNMASDQAWLAYPGDAPNTAVINLSVSRSGANLANGRSGASNITVKGLVLNGSATDSNGLFEFDSGAGINVWSNVFTLSGAQQAVYLFNAQNSNVQGNRATAPNNNSTNLFTHTVNDHVTHDSVVFSDNVTVGGGRFPFEFEAINNEALTNCHIDRNNISNFGSSFIPGVGVIGISFAGSENPENYGNTCSGNVISQPSTSTLSCNCIEIDVWGCTLDGNFSSYCPFGFEVAYSKNVAITNTTFLFSLPIPSGGGAFTPDGDYAANPETGLYIGNYTVNGSSFSGCTTAGKCVLSPVPTGTVPPVVIYPPSPVFRGGSAPPILFQDTFVGSTLNAVNWQSFMTSSASGGSPWNSNGSGGSGLGNTYNADYFNPPQTTQSNGLTLTALQSSILGDVGGTPTTFPVRSGVVNSYGKQAFNGGTIKIVMKVPAGNGSWPSLWLLPATGGDTFEIDIFEGGFTGAGPPNNAFAWHLHQGATTHGGVVNAGVDLTLAFHEYSIVWLPGVSITWFLDGAQIAQVTNSTTPIPNQPMFLIFSMDVGNAASGSFRTALDGTTPTSMAMQVERVTWFA
jgi:hypothetical protein